MTQQTTLFHVSMALFFIVITVEPSIGLSGTDNYLQNPPSINATENPNIVLEVRSHNQTIKGPYGDVATVHLRSYCLYGQECSYMGPTIYTRRNDLINITLINNLRGVGRMSKIMNNSNRPFTGQNYHDPDVTNLHTHGFHVSPNVDNIRLKASPLCSDNILNNNDESDWDNYDCAHENNINNDPSDLNRIQYLYQVPYDHYPGSYWYHSHVHGSTTFQVTQGLFGFIIIEEEFEYKPKMEDVILQFSFVWLHSTKTCMTVTNNLGSFTSANATHPGDCPRVDVPTNVGQKILAFASPNRRIFENPPYYPFIFPQQSLCHIHCQLQRYSEQFGNGNQIIPVPWKVFDPQYPDNTDTYSQYDLSETKYHVEFLSEYGRDQLEEKTLFLVNGVFKPTLKMKHNKWYHFRILNTFSDYLFWHFPSEYQHQCEAYVMGQDGIYFKQPRDLFDKPYMNNTVIVQPGARADIGIACKYDKNVETISIYAESISSEKYGQIGFVPTPRETTVVMLLEIVKNLDNVDAFIPPINTVFTPQPYDDCTYLKDTTTLSREQITTHCSQADPGYPTDEMNQCNVVLGRHGFPKRTSGRRPGGAAGNGVSFNNIRFESYGIHNSNHRPGGADQANICVGDGVVHEWTITTNFHPYHHHTWPFQVQHDIGPGGWIAKAGDWRDIMGAAGTFRMRVNYVTNDNISLETAPLYPDVLVSQIMHCHFVPHEDGGMMGSYHYLVYNQSDGTCPNDDDYIVANKSETATIVDETKHNKFECNESHALTTIDLQDVNTELNITVNILSNCFVNFAFKIRPRTLSVGNMWIGLGFGGTYKDVGHSVYSNATYTSYTNTTGQPFGMNGHGFVVSLQASFDDQFTGKIPVNIITAKELQLNYTWVDDVIYTSDDENIKYIDCDSNTNINDGVISFNCTRYVLDDERDILRNIYKPFDDQTFIWAYGEGVFKNKRTGNTGFNVASYHSSRGGCLFQFYDCICPFDKHDEFSCIHSQDKIIFDIPNPFDALNYTPGPRRIIPNECCDNRLAELRKLREFETTVVPSTSPTNKPSEKSFPIWAIILLTMVTSILVTICVFCAMYQFWLKRKLQQYENVDEDDTSRSHS
eukprot:422240_1